MISNHDRSGWFGASDTYIIMGNWNTKTFEKWWIQKLGISKEKFDNSSTLAGTYKEHQILESLNIPLMELDKQIIIPDKKLRVNLDGNTKSCIYECKTHSVDKPFKVSKNYLYQVWVQIYASGIKQAKIVSYGLKEEDYNNFFLPVDLDRLKLHEIEYNDEFIKKEYLPRLKYLAKCLKEGSFPI